MAGYINIILSHNYFGLKMKITARVTEVALLKKFLGSEKAEFMAVYGRRRVGKTFLIRNFFSEQNCIFFPVTGIQKGTFKAQRTTFCDQISRLFYNNATLALPKNWLETFKLLNTALGFVAKTQKIVLFFDEFPWMATPRSHLIQALEYYWNQYWNHDKRIKLIICGSAASWIIKNIINNTEGLYQRVTYRLKMSPFTLYQTKLFLKRNGITLTHKQITSLYMAMGGIPLYLEQVQKGLSADENIDQICFNKNGLLFDELKELFKSLFKEADIYIKIIKTIAKHRHGISKESVAQQLKLTRGGTLSTRLQELEDAGFIISFIPYQNKERGEFFKVIDEYSLFYFQWIAPNIPAIKNVAQPSGFWLEKTKEGSYHAWKGYAFESICYKHLPQIMNKLHLKSSSVPFSWRSSNTQEADGAQIDLLFDRSDDVITLCEIKYSDKPFLIDKSYAKILEKKRDVFVEQTKTKKQIFFSLLSANGLQESLYSDLIDNIVVLGDLFKE